MHIKPARDERGEEEEERKGKVKKVWKQRNEVMLVIKNNQIQSH